MDTVNDVTSYEMKIIKKGQTNPVYSAWTNRAFEHIQLLVQSRESKSHKMCHFLIILLKLIVTFLL